MTFPLPPAPRTWSAGDLLTTGRLRADPANLAWLLTRRPLFTGSQLTTASNVPASTVASIPLDTEYVDNWNGHTIGQAAYFPQTPGWYLAESTVFFNFTSTANAVFTAGLTPRQNGTSTTLFGNELAASGGFFPGPSISDLVQLNPATTDFVQFVAFQNTSGAVSLGTPGAYATVSFAGLPTSLTGVTNGTVVTSPQPAALWPPGSGTTITNVGGIAAGATSMTVASATGIVVGGTLGLDYFQGTAVQPVAEQVTVTSVTGTTIGISATAYPHLQNAPVAVPVSAAFMNQQVRDVINFLAYPPMARLSSSGSAQALAAQVFPAATNVTFHSATLDNFSGWSGSGTSVWTAPVSGVYYVYGQVLTGALTGTLSAGISVNSGTVQWGDSIRSPNSQGQGAIVRKHVRVTAGQTIQLMTSASAAVSMANTANSYATMLILWRGF